MWVHIGRATQIWEVRIVDDSDRLVCLSRLTVSVVPKAPVGGRRYTAMFDGGAA